jgi:hypothetical protein
MSVQGQEQRKWSLDKYKEYGRLDKYKARLVAKSIPSTRGIDYEETFDPMENINII